MFKVRRGSGRAEAADPDVEIGQLDLPDGIALDVESAVDLEPYLDDEQEVLGTEGLYVVSEDDDVEYDEGDTYAELGEHVASVLQAASEAAARIRQEAEDDAQRIAAATREETIATLNEANRSADRLLLDADRRRVEADKAAAATRDAAEAYADEQRREAQAAAARLIAEADQEAARLAQATADHYQELRDNVEQTEERLEQLVGGLRELATQLEGVLHADARAERPLQSAA